MALDVERVYVRDAVCLERGAQGIHSVSIATGAVQEAQHAFGGGRGDAALRSVSMQTAQHGTVSPTVPVDVQFSL